MGSAPRFPMGRIGDRVYVLYPTEREGGGRVFGRQLYSNRIEHLVAADVDPLDDDAAAILAGAMGRVV